MKDTINTINDHIDILVEIRNTFTTDIRMFFKAHGKLIPITEGPDRGYNREEFDTPENKARHNMLEGERRKLNSKLDRLRFIKRNLILTEAELSTLLK